MIDELREKNVLRDIDVQFGKNLSEVFGAPFAETFLTLLFCAVSSSDTYADTPEAFPFYARYKDEIDEAFSAENLSAMKKAGIAADAPDMNAPIICDGGRIYLKSFYLNEKIVREYVEQAAGKRYEYGEDRLRELFDKYFGPEPDEQKAAALLACVNSFCVISGGPGTGKTTTVFNVLAILCELCGGKPDIAMAAPTGKAASRLTESVTARAAGFDENITENIPKKALTLHRLLKISGGSGTAGYNSRNPMPHDIVVVDEASMVDISMMAALAQAMKPGGRLIMLGDKDQLSSVQPGNVLGDICARSGTDSFSEETARLVLACAQTEVKAQPGLTAMADISIHLKKSRRYDSQGGIGLLAEACRRGDAEAAMEMVTGGRSGIKFIEISGAKNFLKDYAIKRHAAMTACQSPEQALIEAGRTRILTPAATGSFGAQRLNADILAVLASKGLADGTKKYFHGLPVMITENDYNLNLFNGDTGVVFNSGGPRAFFDGDGRSREVSILRMPEWSPVYAMTVHKSQGSEFEDVVFILPENRGRIMTRELFYTAVTRCKKDLTIISDTPAIYSCIISSVARKSGLFI